MIATLHSTSEILGILIAAATLLGLAWAAFGKRMHREWREHREFQKQFRCDWLGEPGRPGVPPRPGVMESLLEIRGGWAALTERLRKAELDLIKVRSEVSLLHNRMVKVERAVILEGESDA